MHRDALVPEIFTSQAVSTPGKLRQAFFAGLLPKGRPPANGWQEYRLVAGNLFDEDLRQGRIGLRVVTQAKHKDDTQDQGQETRQDRAHSEDRVGQDRIAVPLVGVLAPVVFQLISLSAQTGLALLQVALEGNDLAVGLGFRLNQLAAGLGDLGLCRLTFCCSSS